MLNVDNLDKVLRSRVSDGRMLLDATVTNWHERIDIERLEISSCIDCVIGQLFGGFKNRILSKIGLNCANAYNWGFSINPKDNYEINDADFILNKLTIIWKEVISERQKRINEDLIEDLIELSADMELIEV